MKILVFSHSFYPSIGGLEAVSSMLAHEFIRHGHEVKLVTQTPASAEKGFAFEIARRPSPGRLLELVRWSDVYFQNNISLRTAWPLLVVRRPWVVTHQTWIPHDGGLQGLKGRSKHFLLRYATCTSISQAIADHVSSPSIVIPNLYDDQVFYEMPEMSRDKELIFVGRLGPDKGVHLLLDALLELKMQGYSPQLTVVGPGPEELPLVRQAGELRVADQVEFVGVKRENELASLLNRHQILVMPSLWQEPFGVVALEGIACGCVVVGSEGGGLKDTIGPCGVTFPNGDVQALAQKLADLFSNPDKWITYRAKAESHLSRYTKAAVAKAYLRVFEAAYGEKI